MLLILAAIGGAAACRQVVGIPDQSCGICAEQHCGAERAACAASPACTALESCLTACNGSPGCRSQCAIDKPVAVDDATVPAALDACLSSSCATLCNLDCGSLSKIADPTAAPGCSDCLQGVACAEAQACADSAYCQTELRCRETCLTGDCIGDCSLPGYDGSEPLCPTTCGTSGSPCLARCSTGPDANMSLYSTFMDKVAGCRSECTKGNNWSCVGKVNWPGTMGPRRALTLAVTTIIDNEFMTAVTVKMCALADPNCDTIIDQQTTDSHGVVRVVDDTAVVNGMGLDGYLDLSSPEIYPTIVQWGFPLSEPEGILGTPIPVFRPIQLAAAAADNDATLEPGLGHIAMVAVDCLGNQSPGVRFSATGLGPDTKLFYGTNPSSDGPTDTTGSAFFLNVPPGIYDVSATFGTLTVSHQRVIVRADTLTGVGMSPTPLP